MAVEEKVLEQKQMVGAMVDSLAIKGFKALEEFHSFTQEMVDDIVKKMALAALDNHMPLANMAFEETKKEFTKIKSLIICLLQNIYTTALDN